MSNGIAILVSGGIDSAVLCTELTESYDKVYPLYIRHGMHWEAIEQDYLQRFLAAVSSDSIQPAIILDMPVTDIYDNHWSVSGNAVPDHTTPDEAVYIPGRNILLLAKAGVWCERNAVTEIALAPLKGNPFADNTVEFYELMMNALEKGLEYRLEVRRPYAELSKQDVVRKGQHLPLHLTFSCINPQNDLHCGRCNKCAERQHAFAAAGITDATVYAVA